jgi:hypothetical protein
LVPLRSFTVTRNYLPSTGTGKKQVTATQTAPNQTAGPLVVSFSSTTVISNAQARVWQLATATAYAAAKHMLFCQLQSLEKDVDM